MPTTMPTNLSNRDHDDSKSAEARAHALVLLTADLDAEVRFDAPIGRTMTWYSIGGNADVLVQPRSVEALTTIVKRAREAGVPLRVLGSGANLLVHDDGIDGVVVHLSHSVFREVSAIHRHRKNRGGDGSAGDGIRAMAGASMEQIVMNLAKQGMSGLEMMAGIPASIGGAVRMNAGGKFGCVSDSLTAVGVIDLTGNPVAYSRSDLEFSYRRSSMVDPIILWAEFKLTPDDPKRVHAKVKEIFAFKKKSQPMGAKSAGCAFKNPTEGSGDDSPRISAGMLIDRAGLKGFTIGGAQVSCRHANFIAAEKGARAQDVIEIMAHVRKRVKVQTGRVLEPEIVVWERRDGNV